MSLDQIWKETLNQELMVPDSWELLNKIISDWKLDWNDLEAYKALLESKQNDKSKLISENQGEQKKLFMNIAKEMLTQNWFQINSPRDKEVLKYLLWTLYWIEYNWVVNWERQIMSSKLFDKFDFSKLQNWVYKLSEDWRYLSSYIVSWDWRFMESSRFDTKDWSDDTMLFIDSINPEDLPRVNELNSEVLQQQLFKEWLNPSQNLNQEPQNTQAPIPQPIEEKTSQTEAKNWAPVASVVQELVTNQEPEPSPTTPIQAVSTTEVSSVAQEVTTSKPESVDEVSDKSSQLIKKAIEFNNKIDEKTKLKIFEVLNIKWKNQFDAEVILDIKNYQKLNWLVDDWKVWVKTLTKMWIIKHEKLPKTKEHSKKIESSNLIDEISKMSKEELEKKFKTDAQFRTQVLESKQNYKAYYEVINAKQETLRDDNWLLKEVNVEPITAWESNEWLSNEQNIIKQLQEIWIDCEKVEWKNWVYDLDLAWLFDDSELVINPDLTMKFKTSKYEKDWKPKEFNVSNVDDLKIILKQINEIGALNTTISQLSSQWDNNNESKIIEAKLKLESLHKFLDKK